MDGTRSSHVDIDWGWSDEQLTGWLAAAEQEGPPPDPARLAKLREQSAEVFASQSEHPPTPVRRRSPMIVCTMRILAAAVAVAVTALVLKQDGSSAGQSRLDRALRQVAEAKTLQLEMTWDGQAGKALAAQPGRLRINRPDGTYEIARGARAWWHWRRASIWLVASGQFPTPIAEPLGVPHRGRVARPVGRVRWHALRCQGRGASATAFDLDDECSPARCGTAYFLSRA